MLCLVGKKLEEKKRTKRKKSLQVKLKLHSSQSLIPRSGFFSSAKSFLGNQTEPINSKQKCEKKRLNNHEISNSN
jgi:hypothetical protein